MTGPAAATVRRVSVARVAIAVMVIYAALVLLVPALSTHVHGLTRLLFALGIIGLGWELARDRHSAPNVRLAWALLATALGLTLPGPIIRLLAPAGSVPDLGFSLAFPIIGGVCLLGGLWVFTRLRLDRGRAADWLDAGAVVVAGFMIASHFIARGDPFNASQLTAERVLVLLRLATSLGAVLLSGTVWFRRPDELSRRATALLTLGFSCLAITDLVLDQRIQTGATPSGGVLELMLSFSLLLILLGLEVQRNYAPSVREPRTAIRQVRHLVAPFTILVATSPILQLTFGASHDPSHLAFHVVGLVALLILVLVRQHISRRQTIELASRSMAADARFRSLVQRSSDAILQVSTSHVIEWASPSAGDLAGTIPGLLVGRRIAELAHPEDRARLSVFLANASQPFSRNAALRWRIGQAQRWYEVESVVTDLTADAAVGSYVLNTRDVSERVALEHQLRQGQKLEAVGRLAGGIAHDFNNILAAIITHAQLVRDALPDDDVRTADLLEIEETAQRGAVLTRRLLSFSRPEVGDLHPQPLKQVLTGMEPMLRRLLVSQVELAMDLSDDDLWVRTADGQIEQILMNLAINARDAMTEGGVVRVRSRLLVIRPGDALVEGGQGVLPGRWVELTVQDEGTGMEDEVLERLFEPFFTTKPTGLGTGLGLTTVRSIVRSIGGHVSAESAPGAGTTMRVLLPAVQSQETEESSVDPLAIGPEVVSPTATALSSDPNKGPASTEPSDQRDADGVNKLVLVVDDEPALRRAMQRFLERSGYDVVSAGSAHEALQMLDGRAWSVDLVVTDMVMPGMGGREFVRLLRERRADLPIICVSGHMDWEQDELDTSDMPWAPDRLLAKPFVFSDFVDRVRSALTTPPG